MPLLITCCGLIVLVLLMTYFKWNAFLSFLFVAVVVGLCLGINPALIMKSVEKGTGDVLKSIVAIIALGSMLGKLVAKSGAAQKISNTMMTAFNTSKLNWAFMITGFIVGLPLFYGVAFMLLSPIVITMSYRTKIPAIYLALPMLAALSVTQGYLPPHPAPLAIMHQFNAEIGRTLLYGIIVAIPAILIGGILYGKTVKNILTLPNQAFVAEDLPEFEMPSTTVSFFSILTPILLISGTTLASNFFEKDSHAYNIVHFIGDPVVSMFIAVLLAVYFLQIRRGKTMKEAGNLLTEAIKDVATLLLVFAGSGALKEVLTAGGISQTIAEMLQHSDIHPLVLGWLIASIIRVAVGSSTVAGITTAGFIMPIMTIRHPDPHLMVLAIGAGSLMFSHVNESGFWLFREYYQLSMKDTFRTWSIMESIISVMGIIGVMILNWVLQQLHIF